MFVRIAVRHARWRSSSPLRQLVPSSVLSVQVMPQMGANLRTFARMATQKGTKRGTLRATERAFGEIGSLRSGGWRPRVGLGVGIGVQWDALRTVSFSSRLADLLGNTQKALRKTKWVLKKSRRPFNTDDWGAFLSWLLAGNLVLLIIGTTTFFSLLLLTLNTVLARELVAEWVGNLITRNSKLTVTFENAIVPDWKGGRIQFHNCSVSRRPQGDDDDGNYTQFDLTLEEVNVSLDFGKWFGGRGILKEVCCKGVRGEVDRTHVHWAEGDSATNYKNKAQPGDWELENVKVEDVLFTMKNPNGFRPFAVSIYTFEIPVLRKNWLLFDLLNCRHFSGSYDGSLFTMNRLHRLDSFNEERQIDSEVNAHLGRNKYQELDLEDWERFSRVTRFRIDNLRVDHLNAGMSGPFGWIHKGTVDMIADIIVPRKNASNPETLDEVIGNYTGEKRAADGLDPHLFVMDFYLRLNNPRASVPFLCDDLSYVNSALIRPIVAYINANRTFIPIRCRVYKDVGDFDGSWTFYDSLLMDDLSQGVYDSFAEYVSDEQHQSQRLRKVGLWTLHFVVQMVLWSLSGLNG